jgi:transposase
MRTDLQPLRAGDEISTGLRLLTARRADKSADRVRAINRLQAQLLEYFPALERAFDYSRSKAALLLLTKYRTPDGIRRAGQARIHGWLRKHGARSSAAVAAAAVEAAESQHTIVPAQHMGEGIVAALAREILTLNEELAELDALISEKVTEHQHTEVLLSMPGFGPVLAAEFLGATDGTSPSSSPPTGSPASSDSPRHPETPEKSAETTAGPDAMTDGSSGSSTSPGSPH